MGMAFSIASSLMLLAQASAPSTPPPRIQPGTIVVEAQTDNAPDAAYAAAVERALLDAESLPVPTAGSTRYIARLAVTKSSHGQVASNAKDEKPEPSADTWGGGGVTVRLPSRKRQLRDLVMTELSVTILERKDQRVVWQGRAMTVQADGTAANAPATVAAKLAGAMFRQFPAPATAPITVP